MKANDVPLTGLFLVWLLAFAIGASPVFAQPETPSTQSVKWVDFDTGLEMAKKQKKQVLVDIYTDWCQWCKEMEAKVFSHEDVVAYINENFIPIKFNAESNERVTYKGKTMTMRELSFAMGITSYPTTVFLKPNGEPITRLGGYVAAETYRDVIQYINVKAYEKMDFETWQKQRIKR